MKRINVSIFAVIAIVMAVAASAFTTSTKLKAGHSLTTTWFRFMGDPSNLTQLQDHTKYELVDGLPCSGEDVICAVNYTSANGIQPDAFSSSFKSRIASVYNGTTQNDPAISEEDE